MKDRKEGQPVDNVTTITRNAFIAEIETCYQLPQETVSTWERTVRQNLLQSPATVPDLVTQCAAILLGEGNKALIDAEDFLKAKARIAFTLCGLYFRGQIEEKRVNVNGTTIDVYRLSSEGKVVAEKERDESSSDANEN